MPYVRLPGGVVVHVKMAKPRRHRCCGTVTGQGCPDAATIQCDYAVAVGKTCDAWCCEAHALEVGPDVHHCPVHRNAQRGLFTGLPDA